MSGVLRIWAITDFNNDLGLDIRGIEYLPTLFHLPQLFKKYKILPSIKIIPARTLRRLPSLMWQFPWTTLWSKSEVLIRTKKKTYSLDNMEELFK